jgi:hypothetical protein
VLAALALQAKVERLPYRVLTPTAIERVSTHHLEQQMRPAAGRVHLFARRLKAGAHDLAAQRAAFADAKAALRRLGE